MYLPQVHEEKDPAVLHSLIRAHPLGAWVTTGPEGLTANHIPFLLDTAGTQVVLRAHVARANPVWGQISSRSPSVVMFQGAESYITPSWYPGKHQHGKAVPTWNYVVVHAHGVARAVDDAQWLRAHLDRLTDTHEMTQAVPWKIGDAPDDYIRRMIEGIVGIEIPVDRIEGKWKVSQNRSAPDRLGVVAGLLAREDGNAQAMAELVRRHVPG
jgi:transcriptional regulator